MNTVPSSAWHLLAELAQLAHESINNLALLAGRVAAVLSEQAFCPQGVILRLDQQRGVLAAWGLSEPAAQSLLPPPTTNGAGPFHFPQGWHTATLGTPQVPGLLAIYTDPGVASADFVLALGAQLTLLWQTTLIRAAQLRQGQFDPLIAACSAVTTPAELRSLLATSTPPQAAWTITIVELDEQQARTFTPPIQLVDPLDTLLSTVPGEPTPLPEIRPAWLDQRPGLYLRVATKAAPRGLVAITGNEAADPDTQASLAGLLRHVAAIYERLILADEFAKRERALDALNGTLQGLAGQLNSEEFIHSLIARATELLDAAGGGIYFYDQANSTLELRTIYQIDQDLVGLRVRLGEGVAGRAAETGQAFAVSNYQTAEERVDWPQADRFSAVAAAPLYEGDLLIGVLSLVHTTAERSFSSTDLSLLESFATQASLAIRTARLFDAQRKQARELFVLYENSRTVGSSLDLRHILERLTENVILALSVERSVVLLWDAERHECELVAVAVDESVTPALEDAGLGSRYTPHPNSVAALVISSNQPVVVNDVATDPRLEAHRPTLLKRSIRSMLGVPLMLQDQLIGVLISNTYSIPRSYSVSEITLAQTLAGQAAVAIGNARLLSEERRRTVELSLLQELGTRLNAGLGLEPTLSAISAGVRQLHPDVELEICLYDPETQTLQSAHSTEVVKTITSETGVYRLEEGFTGWLARHRTPLRIDDIHHQRIVRPLRDSAPAIERFRGYLGLPLLVGEELIGTLELGAPTANRFDAEDERLLTIISAQAAQAIRNVRRYEATDEVLRERVRELTALQRISRELTSTLRLEQLLPAMLDEILEATGCSNGLVALRQEDGSEFQIIAEHGYPSTLNLDRDIAPLLSTGPLAESLSRAEALVVDDVTQIEGETQWPAALRSILMAPIMYEEQVAGVIIAGSEQSYGFNRAALDFVRAVSDQAALAIGNAQHFAEQVRQRDLLQQRASLLNEVLEIGNALRADMELNVLLEQIAFSVTEAAGFRVVVFSLIDLDQPEIVRTVTGAGLALSELAEQREKPLAISTIDQYLDAQYRLGRAYFVPDPASDQASEVWHAQDRLLVPLYSTERALIGVMTVDDPFSRQRPTRRIVETLEIFANQAAIAVENAYLFAERSRRIAELGLINRISRAATASLNITDLASQVHEVLRKVLPIDAYYLGVYNQTTKNIVASVVIEGENQQIGVLNGPLIESTLTGWIVSNAQPLFFNDIVNEIDKYPGLQPRILYDKTPHSWIGVPLQSGDGAIRGVLSIQHFSAHMYSQRDVNLLTTVANQLAVAVENARLYGDTQQRLQELALVNRVGTLTNSTLDFVEIMTEVYRAISSVFTIDGFYSFIYDPEQQEVVLELNVEQDQMAIEHVPHTLTPRTPSEWVIRHQKPLLFHDMPAEVKRRFKVKRAGQKQPIRSWVGVPLKISDDTSVGMISIQSYTPQLYSEREQGLLQTVASQVALAVQNARLFNERERQIRELNAIGHIGEVMSASFDLDDMLFKTAQELEKVTGAGTFTALLYDPDTKTITRAFDVEDGKVIIEEWKTGAPFSTSLSHWVLQQRKPLVINDFHDQEQYVRLGITPFLVDDKIPRSWIGIPVLAEDGAPIGCLSLQDYRSVHFDQRTVAFLTNVATHMSLGLQKVQLFRDRDRQIRELDMIRRVGQVTSSTLDMNQLMGGVYRVLRAFLPIDDFMINIYDPQSELVTHSLVIEAGQEAPAPAPQRVNPRSLAGWMLAQRKPLLFGNLETELGAYPELELAPQQSKHSSWLGVPLLAKNEQPIGIIALQNHQPERFADQDMQFLMNVANQVTLGVQNVRLYEQAEQNLTQLSAEAERLALINHVSNQTASTLDTQVLYDLAVEEMARATSADQARLLIFDFEQNIGIARAEYPYQGLTVQVPVVGNATIPWLQEHRRPLIINDAETSPLLESVREIIRQLGVRHVLIVPLIVNGEIIGSVGLDSTKAERSFTNRDAETCQTIANQVAQALENARLFAETERQAQALTSKVGELSVLLEAGQAISSLRDPDQVLETLVRLVARQLQVDTVILSTITSDGVLIPAASLGLPSEFISILRVERGQGMVGRVAETAQPLAIADIEHEHIRSQYPAFNVEHGLVSFLGVPVLYRGEVTGVLSVMTDTPRQFDADEIALLAALAGQAAIALENARLFDERERQISVLQALNEVAQAVTSTLDRDALLRQLHTKLGLVFDTRSSMIALYDQEKNLLTFPVVMNDGSTMELDPLLLGEGALSQVVRNRRTITLQTSAEIQNATRVVLGGTSPIASWIGVPITSGDQVLGIINIQDPNPHAFSMDMVQFLQAVASQAAISLENARLFAERERQIKVAETLSNIGQVVTATLKPEELAEAIIANLAPILDTSNAYIAFYDSRSDNVTITAGNLDSVPFRIPRHTLAEGFLKSVMWENQQPLLTYSAADREALGIQATTANPQRYTEAGSEQSIIAAPILSENVPLGAVVVYSEQPSLFDRADLQFLIAVANQSSNAIQKAVFFGDLDRHLRELEALNQISQAVTSTISLQEILLRLHEGMSAIIDTDTSFIALYDETSNMLSYPITLDRGTPVSFPPRPPGVSATGWVIQNRQPLLLNTHDEMNEYRDEQARRELLSVRVGPADILEQSYLIVPIVVGNSVLGVINIQSFERYAFSEYDMSFVTTVAGQAATSINNARLFEARERSIQHLRTLNMIGQALGSTVRFEDLLRVIYEQTSLLMDTSNFYMALYNERRREVSFPLFFEHGEPVRIEPQRNGAGLTEYVIRTRQPLLLLGNVREQLQQFGIEAVGDISQSWLGIPMIAADKVVGIMSVQDYTNERAYTEDDVQLLSTVANQVAQALENARLFSESRESVRELSTLSETSVSLASTLEIDELLAISASSAIEMARADFGGMFLIDDEEDEGLITHALILNRDRMEMPLPTGDDASVGEIKVLHPLRDGQVVQVYDAQTEPSLQALTHTLGMRGVVFLPMHKEGLRGIAFVGMDQPYVFEDRSIASLLILTTQIGQALDNAQLFTQIRHFNSELEAMVGQRTQALAEAYAQLTNEKERVEVLYNIATELGTTLDRSELLVRTLDLAAQALNINRGSVLLLDRETKVLTCEAILNEEVGLRSLDIPIRLEQGEGLANWVLDNAEGVVIEDIRIDKRWVSIDGRSEDVRSVIAVPLLSSETPQGVLMLSSTQVGYFTQDHLRFLSTIGGEVSSALHNADLYNLVYESADRLSDAMWQQREEASKTTAILQSVSEGVIVLDHVTEKIMLYNPAAEQILQIPSSEVYNKELTTFAVARDEDEQNEGRALMLYTSLKEGILAVQATELTQNLTIDLPGQNLAANFALVTGADESRFGVVIVVRDITREIEADRAKRDFIATVSHELRTPLTPIRGFVDLLMLGALGTLTDPQKEALTTVKNNTMRMLGLVEDLLEIGRLEAGKIQLNTVPSNINQLVRDTVSTWQLELERKRMTLDLELDESLPLVEYDTKRIGQVLTNLVSNAIKYTKDGGAVWVSTFRNKDGMIQIDVRDTGVGLTPDDQRKLFQRFYRADSELRDQVGGTGLGLSIAKSFVELHNGDMWVTSVAGEGSTFSSTLPEHQPRPDLGESDDLNPG